VKRLAALLLCFLPLAGCRTWDVRAFDIPLNGKEPRPELMSANAELSSEEKAGVILIVGVAIGASVAIALAAN